MLQALNFNFALQQQQHLQVCSFDVTGKVMVRIFLSDITNRDFGLTDKLTIEKETLEHASRRTAAARSKHSTRVIF